MNLIFDKNNLKNKSIDELIKLYYNLIKNYRIARFDKVFGKNVDKTIYIVKKNIARIKTILAVKV